jgi:hypothetical protein
MIRPMSRRTAGIAATTVALLVAIVLVGNQVLASAGAPAPRVRVPSPAAAIDSADDECAGGDAGHCGNEHSKAVRAWITCKAEKGKRACVKPTPPGKALGHTKHADRAPGPASADGQGHGWGRAHAPGQLKRKNRAKHSHDEDEDHDGGS